MAVYLCSKSLFVIIMFRIFLFKSFCEYIIFIQQPQTHVSSLHLFLKTFPSDVLIGGVGTSHSQYATNCKKGDQNVGHAARELATVFSVTLFVTIVIKWLRSTPPQQKVCLHISDIPHK